MKEIDSTLKLVSTLQDAARSVGERITEWARLRQIQDELVAECYLKIMRNYGIMQ